MTTLEVPEEKVINNLKETLEEGFGDRDRDPCTALNNRVLELIYGNSYLFKPPTVADIERFDPSTACTYFSNCYKDPSTFVVVILGDIDPSTVCPLILLGGIPKSPVPILNFTREELHVLPFTLLSKGCREFVQRSMQEPRCEVELCYPIKMVNDNEKNH